MSAYNDGLSLPKKEKNAEAESFGLTMVNILIGQLEGTLELKQNMGTEFIITFPYDGTN
ncbi:MAG: hypothetical protein PF693_03985 [Spirochaetia bacterium]|jgi:two-component sensor histidine kinase|nr:hypothetical protein [Spirochaetia bacterium]